ncbi:MAG: type IV toxin-antitoxin system AbiEi family antitoxin domain-containing protein [Deltaproteobacteria bacterium]|nr:type IV toxin-antitoxin system AbiEi family antitoxin domain-containing protein [Deltaproteobacteria bacterium]
MTTRSKIEEILALTRRHGILRPRDLVAVDAPRSYLQRMVARGVLERTARGLYRLAGHEAAEHHSTAEACKRVPHGVVCLLSALRFHDLTTQAPFEVWMAIDVKARAPVAGYPPLRIVRMSGEARSAGIEEHRVEGVAVRVYSTAKTVADCFKYRNKIGLDVAVEALRDYRRARGSMNDLWRFARTCRVANVMRPYLEATA